MWLHSFRSPQICPSQDRVQGSEICQIAASSTSEGTNRTTAQLPLMGSASLSHLLGTDDEPHFPLSTWCGSIPRISKDEKHKYIVRHLPLAPSIWRLLPLTFRVNDAVERLAWHCSARSNQPPIYPCATLSVARCTRRPGAATGAGIQIQWRDPHTHSPLTLTTLTLLHIRLH